MNHQYQSNASAASGLIREAAIRGPLQADQILSQLLGLAIYEALEHPEVVSALTDLERVSDDSPAAALSELLHASRDEISAAATDDLISARKYLADAETAIEAAVRQVIAANPDLSAAVEGLNTEITRLRSATAAQADRDAGAQTYAPTDEPSKTAVEGDPAEAGLRDEQEAAARDKLAAVERTAVGRVFDRLSAFPRVTATIGEAEAALIRSQRALVQRGALEIARPWLRDKLNEKLRDRYSPDLVEQDAPGLSELANPDHEVPTAATDALWSLLDRLPGGSIGLSGPRGSGKSTLLRWLSRGETPIRGTLPRLAFTIPAPVEYVPLEFVLHLFARACSEVLGKAEGENAPLPSADRRRLTGSVILVAIVLSVGIGAIGLATTLSAFFDDTATTSQRRIGIALAAIIAIAAAVLVARERRGGLYEPEYDAYGSRSSANDLREELAYRAFSGRLGMLIPLVAGALLLATSAAAVAAELPNRVIDGVLPSMAAFAAVALLFPLLRTSMGLWIRSALESVEADAGRPSDRRVSLMTRTAAADGLAHVSTTLTLVAAAIVAAALIGYPPSPAMASGVITAAIGVTGLRLGLRLHGDLAREGATTERALFDQARAQPALVRRALEHIREIRYEQTASSGWSGKIALTSPISLPIGAETAVSESRALAERQWTLPDATERLREFLRLAATDEPVVVGIDEIDKMNADAAERFLNGTKGIFGVEGCYFILSVSEDAAAGFERRGLPFRDVFDSSLDEVVRVDHLGLRETERLLGARVVRLPMQFVALCYCMSGGLPRDVIRIARALFRVRRETSFEALGPLAEQLITRDFHAKAIATRTSLRRHEKSRAIEAFEALASLHTSAPTIDTFVAVVGSSPTRAYPGDDVELGKALSLVDEFLAYGYFCATLLEVFDDGLDAARMQRAEAPETRGGTLVQLAIARQRFALGALSAWRQISEFRADWGLSVLPIPLLEPEGQQQAAT